MKNRKRILDIIFASEKRKMVLMELKSGPKQIEFFLESLKTTRQSLLPQLRILEDSHLLTGSDDTYQLTTIGKLIVERMFPLVNTVEVLESDVDYWGERYLDFIPPDLLKRIDELQPCNIVSSVPFTEIYEPSKPVLQEANISEHQYSVTTFLFPEFPSILADFRKNDVKMHIIVSEELLSKLKSESDDYLRDLLNDDNNYIYLYPHKMNFMSFGHNDFSFMMRPLTNKSEYDYTYMVSNAPSAIEWGKELFEHYLKDSIPVNEF